MQSLFLAYLLYLTYEAPSVNLMKLLVKKKEDRPTKKKNMKTAVKENGAEEEEEVEVDKEEEGKGQKRKKVQ